jgi:hypothetical protein
MFFEYSMPAGPRLNGSPPAPIMSGCGGPENFVQSRWVWHVVQPTT